MMTDILYNMLLVLCPKYKTFVAMTILIALHVSIWWSIVIPHIHRQRIFLLIVSQLLYTGKVIYDGDDNLKGVKRTSPTRRALLATGELDAAEIEGRRLDFADCADCEEAFDAVCEGALSVCDLEDFGYPFSAAAAASIDTVCVTFGSACSRLQASVACQDQCTTEGVYYCQPRYSLYFSCFSRRRTTCLPSVYPKHWCYNTARINITRRFLCQPDHGSERSWATWRRSDGSIQH